jgi:hypothetical protein
VSVTQKTAAGALEMTAAYKYDAFGNRIEKDVTTYSGGTGTPTTTRFAYDGWNPAKAGATRFGPPHLSRFESRRKALWSHRRHIGRSIPP